MSPLETHHRAVGGPKRQLGKRPPCPPPDARKPAKGSTDSTTSHRTTISAGQTIEQLLEAHPRLTREGALAAVLAAVRFGAEVLRAEVAYPVSKSVA